MFAIDVNPPRRCISVDEGEAKVQGAEYLPFQHLGMAATEV